MEIIKRKILREDIITRESGDEYGTIKEPYIYVNFFLTQTIDNMGLFTDHPFIEGVSEGQDEKQILEGYRPQFQKKKWHKAGTKVTGLTDSKLVNMRGYKDTDRYKVGFDSNKEIYTDFKDQQITGVSRITTKEDNLTTYVVDAKNDGNVGTEGQTTGLRYVDNTNGITTVDYIPQGVNATNSSLSAITKEEYLMGIISTPEIKNDVFIDRGELSVTEPHLRLSEVETLEHLTNYGNGYYNVTK